MRRFAMGIGRWQTTSNRVYIIKTNKKNKYKKKQI
jgi:hypothetical protein